MSFRPLQKWQASGAFLNSPALSGPPGSAALSAASISGGVVVDLGPFLSTAGRLPLTTADSSSFNSCAFFVAGTLSVLAEGGGRMPGLTLGPTSTGTADGAGAVNDVVMDDGPAPAGIVIHEGCDPGEGPLESVSAYASLEKTVG